MCTTLRMATRSVGRLYDHALAQAGLRAASYAILSRVDADGPLPLSQLATRLAMERTTCSREVEPLVRAGLLRIEPGKDRRQRVVHLAPEGAEKLAEGRPHWEAVQQRVVEAFGSENAAGLLDQLRGLLGESERLTTH